MLTRDIFLFSEYLNARSTSNEAVASFYARRFSPQLTEAHEAWKRSGRSTNVLADDPFETNLYRLPLAARADAAESEGKQLWNESGVAAEASNHYILISVVLAAVLFFAGVAPQFETRKKRDVVLMLGMAGLLVAIGMFVMLPRPKEKSFSSPEYPSKLIP